MTKKQEIDIAKLIVLAENALDAAYECGRACESDEGTICAYKQAEVEAQETKEILLKAIEEVFKRRAGG